MNKCKKKWNGILYEGGYDNFSINSAKLKNNPYIERKKRIQFAFLLATNPKAFETISKNNVTLFHGTNANALPSILKYGLKSGKELENESIPIITGEEWSRRGAQRSFISFTDNLETAVKYAAMPASKDSQQNLSFGVIVGLSSKATSDLPTCRVTSELVELGFEDSIPLEYIEVLAVPKDKAEFVSKLVNGSKIQVLSLDLNENFYFRDNLTDFDITIPQALEFSGAPTSETNKTFSAKSLQKTASDRKLSDIHKIFGKIKKFFKEIFLGKGENNGKDFRNEWCM